MIASTAVRISPRSAPRFVMPSGPQFHDQRRRIVLGAPEPAACPFCAQRDELVIVATSGELDCVPGYHVTCECCGADGPLASSRRAAAVLWNEQGVTAENRYYRQLCGPGEV